MMELIRALSDPLLLDHPALVGSSGLLSRAQTLQAATELSARLREAGCRRLALWADNGPAWVIADLACLLAGACCVPLPLFFSPGQLSHVLTSAGCDHLLAQDALPQLPGEGSSARAVIAGEAFSLRRLGPAQPSATAKLTFTSGTTGQPKGVQLGARTLATVAGSLSSLLRPQGIRRHLAVLPLATLLENLAGVYVSLLCGAAVHLPALTELGYSGASNLDLRRFLGCLHRAQPESLILVPQLLQALVGAAEAGARPPASLRFVAVGGARVAPALLARAQAQGIPAFEGYGLSECASVVALNLPGAQRPGSVGRPLTHARVRISAEGEIEVAGALFDGYLGEPAPAGDGWLPTGDLGHLDAEGFLHVTGRRKNVFITSYGRNVSPEWVESELLAEPQIEQAAVFGEARSAVVAVLSSRADDQALAQAVERANARLPDYARIRQWRRAPAPFSRANDQLTANGRPRREAIWHAYGPAFDAAATTRSTSCSSTTG